MMDKLDFVPSEKKRYSTVILPQLVNHQTDALSMDYEMASWVGKFETQFTLPLPFTLTYASTLSIPLNGFKVASLRPLCASVCVCVCGVKSKEEAELNS
jgi:hypothetical protein